MPPSNQLEEVGALAAMVDENQLKYSLDAICQRYGLPGKDETLLLQGIEAARPREGQKKINAREPTSGDCRRVMSAPMPRPMRCARSKLYEILIPIIEREGTRDAYRLEVDLMPVTIAMRRRGIRIDQDAAEQARRSFLGKRDAALKELSDQHGAPVSMDEINSPKWKDATFERYGIISPRKTPKRRAFVHGRQFGMDGRP